REAFGLHRGAALGVAQPLRVRGRSRRGAEARIARRVLPPGRGPRGRNSFGGFWPRPIVRSKMHAPWGSPIESGSFANRPMPESRARAWREKDAGGKGL